MKSFLNGKKKTYAYLKILSYRQKSNSSNYALFGI